MNFNRFGRTFEEWGTKIRYGNFWILISKISFKHLNFFKRFSNLHFIRSFLNLFSFIKSLQEKGWKSSSLHDWQIGNFFSSSFFSSYLLSTNIIHTIFSSTLDNIFIKRFLFLPARTDEFLPSSSGIFSFLPLKENGKNGLCIEWNSHSIKL